MTSPDRPHRNFYGRLKGKALKSSQKTYLSEDLAALSPGAVDWESNPDRQPLDLAALFVGVSNELVHDIIYTHSVIFHVRLEELGKICIFHELSLKLSNCSAILFASFR